MINTSQRQSKATCSVPVCHNTKFSAPGKIFFPSPSDKKRRNQWLVAMKRKDKPSPKTVFYVCEDHFDLEQDIQNLLKIRLMPCTRPVLKPNVVPSIFDCQGRKRIIPRKSSYAIAKERKSIVEMLLKEGRNAPQTSGTSAESFESNNVCQDLSQLSPIPGGSCSTPETSNTSAESFESNNVCQDLSQLSPIPGVRGAPETLNTSSEIALVDTNPKISSSKKRKTKYFRSKGVQCKLLKFKDAQVSPLKHTTKDVSLSPIKLARCKIYSSSSSLSSSCEENVEEEERANSDPTYEPESQLSSEEDNDMQLIMQKQALEVTRHLNAHKPMHYLGVPLSCKFLLDILIAKIVYTGRVLSCEDILTLILRKIRRNFTFQTLGDMYSISESYACRIYNKYLPYLSQAMQGFVKMLPVETVELNLPVAFWARFSNVYIIIDCFEIEIQKPMNSMDQSETFSSYKSCNTAKYLIGTSPDGTIMFISKGFVGRQSDMKISEESGFIDSLPKFKDVMCDRGFKHIEEELIRRNCKIVRPPSTVNKEKLSKSKVKKTQKVASLRSHVERSIGRIREFRFLNIHSALPGSMLNELNEAVFLACALVNCHSNLINV